MQLSYESHGRLLIRFCIGCGWTGYPNKGQTVRQQIQIGNQVTGVKYITYECNELWIMYRSVWPNGEAGGGDVGGGLT